MIIDQLPSITLPVEDTDEMPIERGQYTYKINLADLLGSASANITVIAAEYDATASYAVGDYCTHEGLFYRCITPVTAEAWDATKWEEVTVGEELQNVDVDVVYVGTTEPTDENIKIWLDTDEPGMSAVSSVNGKTGTVELWDVVWENASPTSSFSAQTVSIDLSGYEFVIIEFSQNTSNDDYYYGLAASVDSKTHIAIGYYGGRMARRFATVTSTGVIFGNGQWAANYNASFTDASPDSIIVPIKIRGFK